MATRLRPFASKRSAVEVLFRLSVFTPSPKIVMQAVSPQVVVVSCGKDNSYGHPHKEAMQNFAAVGAQVLRTDELGSIAVWEQEGEVG